MACPLSRSLGRVQAGQSLQDLSYSCLITLEQHHTEPEMRLRIRQEILSRLSSF